MGRAKRAPHGGRRRRPAGAVQLAHPTPREGVGRPSRATHQGRPQPAQKPVQGFQRAAVQAVDDGASEASPKRAATASSRSRKRRRPGDAKAGPSRPGSPSRASFPAVQAEAAVQAAGGKGSSYRARGGKTRRRNFPRSGNSAGGWGSRRECPDRARDREFEPAKKLQKLLPLYTLTETVAG